jgi:uncharacterized protein YcbK (DUF882 family)
VSPVTTNLLGRRAFLLGGLCAFGLTALPARAKTAAPTGARYMLWLERMQTGERVAAPFTLDGKSLYVPGYAQLCAIMRDEHVSPTEGYVQISIRTIEALWAVQKYLAREGVFQPIVVHSGYRTPETNAHTEGAARQSLHMYGMAVDFHVPGVAIDYLAQICMACTASGGVGYYPGGWVHLDTGAKRYWSG